MDSLGVALMFESQSWPAGLSAAATAALVAEAVALLLPLRRAARAAFWTLLPAAAVGGAILAWVWGSWAGEATPLMKLLGEPLSLPARAAILVTIPALATTFLLLIAAIASHLVTVLSGREGMLGFVGALARGAVLAALAGLTAFWVPPGAVIAIGTAAVCWAARSYRRTTSPVRRPVKLVLLGLRVLAAVLLTAWAMRPALEYRRQEEVKTVLLICADTSSSMQRRDVAGASPATQPGVAVDPLSRIEAVRQVLESRRAALAELNTKADLELVPFAASASPPESFAPETGWGLFALRRADGQGTALGDALAEACALYADQQREVGAIVVLSDGCNNTADTIGPDKFAAMRGSDGVPIHTIAVGSDRVTASIKTLTARDLGVPDEVEAFNRLPITANIETIGLQGRQVKVVCKFGEEEVGSETLPIGQLQSVSPVRFVHVPLSAGFHRVSVAAEVLGGNPPDLAGRPDASRLVHVVDREMRLLYVEGKFRYEAKYIARALVAARRFSLDRRVLLQPLHDVRPTALSENVDDWLAYHAVILGDVAASHFTGKQLEIVRELVGKYGKGLCMVGGSKAFGRGGWENTPVADVLPIDLGASASQIDAPVQVLPTREGRDSDVMRIGEGGEDIAAAWGKLDPLPGANKLGGLKPAATALAESADGAPLIVTQPYGKGRAMAIAFDTTWRWVLTKKDTADLQRRFWRQVALFLAAPKGTVWITTDKTNYDLRKLRLGTETIRISAGVEDAHGRPLLSVPVRVTVTAPGGGDSPILLRKVEKMRKGQLPPPGKGGTYVLKISASVGGKALAAEHHFEVLQRDLESLEVLANHGLLRRMSTLSNGQFAPLSGFDDLIKELHITTKPQKRETAFRVALSGRLRWPTVIALILLLCAEWAFRKRKGLV